MIAKLVELIEAKEHIGAGKADNPFRIVRRWYTKEGQLVVELDEWRLDTTKAFREVSIVVLANGDLKIDSRSGEWEKGCTYKFTHPYMGGTP